MYGKSTTPYGQWNAYVQHERCTRRSLQTQQWGGGGGGDYRVALLMGYGKLSLLTGLKVFVCNIRLEGEEGETSSGLKVFVCNIQLEGEEGETSSVANTIEF